MNKGMHRWKNASVSKCHLLPADSIWTAPLPHNWVWNWWDKRRVPARESRQHRVCDGGCHIGAQNCVWNIFIQVQGHTVVSLSSPSEQGLKWTVSQRERSRNLFCQHFTACCVYRHIYHFHSPQPGHVGLALSLVTLARWWLAYYDKRSWLFVSLPWVLHSLLIRHRASPGADHRSACWSQLTAGGCKPAPVCVAVCNFTGSSWD